jgi:hypothetical protein
MTDRELMQMALQNIQNSIGITKEEWKPRAAIISNLLRERLAHPESVHAIDISQERVDETAKHKHEWAGLKSDDAVEDLKKARFYIEREIKRLGGEK